MGHSYRFCPSNGYRTDYPLVASQSSVPMSKRSRKFWKRGFLITLVVVSVPALLSKYWEVGLMGIHAISEKSAHQRAFEREVCGDNEQRQAQIKALMDSRVWVFRQSIEDRPPDARLEVGASDRLLNEVFGPSDSEAATTKLRTLYWYEYCRDNNAVLDVYDQQFNTLVAVYRGGTRRRGSDREWDDFIYDCRSFTHVDGIINDLIALGFWKKVEPMDEGWRGNKYLAVHELPKFRPQDAHEGVLSPEERGNREATRYRYYSAAALWGVCTGHHHKLRIAAPQGGFGGEIVKTPYIIKRDLEKIRGVPVPDW